jgi:hypothetical protein
VKLSFSDETHINYRPSWCSFSGLAQYISVQHNTNDQTGTIIITLHITEVAIKKGQSREPGNIGYTRRRRTKQKHKIICFQHHYAKASTNNANKTRTLLQTAGGKDKPSIVNKTWALLQTAGGKAKPNIIFMRKLYHFHHDIAEQILTWL